MKQHISIEQLNELTPKGKDNLRKWWKPQLGDWVCITRGIKNIKQHVDLNYEDSEWGYLIEPGEKPSSHELPLLSIGQMIEFLGEERVKNTFTENYPGYEYNELRWVKWSETELCDALWEAVKEVLNSTT